MDRSLSLPARQGGPGTRLSGHRNSKPRGILTLTLSVALLFTLSGVAQAVTYSELANHWAPVWRQDTAGKYREDYIAAVNFDGDWRGNNNWENTYNYKQFAYVYYAVAETPTHYFITYADFHPRDWNNAWLGGCGPDPDCHENDMEGAMVVVRKDGSPYGAFHLMETQAHGNFYQFTNDPAITTGSDNVDAGVAFENGKNPVLYVESKGHGVCSDLYSSTFTCSHTPGTFPGGDGVIYRVGSVAQYPSDLGHSTGKVTSATYVLKPMEELWSRRCNIGNGQLYDKPFTYQGARNSFTYSIGGAFDGDTKGDDAANPPWGWDDGDDGPAYKGDWFLDPAYTIETHLNGLGTFSLDYTYNPWLASTTC
ncbi:MAG: hypothetical protein QXO51_08320 [Halobacteria archaeon]